MRVGVEQSEKTEAFPRWNNRGNDGSHSQIELLGRARFHANGGSCHLEIWRKYALPGIYRAGWDAIYFGLRDGVTNAG